MRSALALLPIAVVIYICCPAWAASPEIGSCPAQPPAQLVSAGELTFGTVNPPASAGLSGLPAFEMDLATELAKTMCLKPAFVQLAFAGLFPGLNARKFDAAIAAIEISRAREPSYDFVPYFLRGMRLVVRKGSGLFFKDESEVCGHTVALLAGSVEVYDLEKYKGGCPAGRLMELHIYPTNNEVLEQLRKGTVEGIFIDWASAAEIVHQNPEDFAVGSPILTGEPPGQPRHRDGIMVRKGDSATQTAIAQALAHLQANGTYERLLNTWNLREGDIRSGD
jgi:polar amino acid transport system substrate-binding protein